MSDRSPVVRLANAFTRAVPIWMQLTAGLLSVIVSLTEGIGLALLAPLIALISSGPTGSLGRRFAEGLEAIGLPLSLPVLIALFVGLVAARALVIRARDVLNTKLYLAFADHMRWRLFDAISLAQWSVIAKERRPFLTTSLTSDVERVGQGVNSLLQFPALALTAAVQIAIALWVAPLITLVVLALGGLIATLAWSSRAGSYRANKDLAATMRDTFDLTSEFFAGLKLSKSHSADARHRRTFHEAFSRQQAQVLAYARRSANARLLLQLGSAAALGLFVYFGASQAKLSAPELLVLIVIFARLMPLVGSVQNYMQSLRLSLPVLENLLALIGRCQAGAEAPAGADVAPIALREAVRFSGAGFRYDQDQERSALRDINLLIPAGQVVALVGASGAGKSTLSDLAVGLITPSSGEVLINGAPLKGETLTAWRRSVAYVLQENFLFHDTVRANLLWARPDATEEDLRRVLSLTGSQAIVAALPKGLDSLVGDRGTALSGGERQRLALACALLREPTLLVLDEATNALDQESERAMWELIGRLRGAMTILIIAHRLNAIQAADRIVVLEDGRIVQQGAWEELVRSDGQFARLVKAAGAEEAR